MTRRQFADAFQHRTAIGDITPGQIVFDCQRIGLAAQQRMRGQGFELGAENQAAVAERCHEQRLHAQPVTRQEQRALAEIVDRKGKHAIEPRQAIRAPFLPSGKDNLAITVGVKLRTRRAQFLAQFAVIIDLAVEHQHCPAIGRGHRLRRSGDIDDRQAPVAEANARRGPHAKAVRPAVSYGIAHPLDPRRIDRLGRREVKNPGKSAHRSAPSGQRRCGPSSRQSARWIARMRRATAQRVARFALQPRGSALSLAAPAGPGDPPCWRG